ncbi:MAG: hypothetical protein ACOYK6_06405, partial [Chthoniobacterales bacterium]
NVTSLSLLPENSLLVAGGDKADTTITFSYKYIKPGENHTQGQIKITAKQVVETNGSSLFFNPGKPQRSFLPDFLRSKLPTSPMTVLDDRTYNASGSMSIEMTVDIDQKSGGIAKEVQEHGETKSSLNATIQSMALEWKIDKK